MLLLFNLCEGGARTMGIGPIRNQDLIFWPLPNMVSRRNDWGTQGNLQRYNQTTPPYLLSRMPPTFPVALFSGGADYLADPIDVAGLKRELDRV